MKRKVKTNLKEKMFLNNKLILLSLLNKTNSSHRCKSKNIKMKIKKKGLLQSSKKSRNTKKQK